MERMDDEQVAAQVRKQAAGERSVRCAVCATEASGSLNACTVCGTTYHSDCWAYNGGCAVYGCKAAPRAPEPLEINVTSPLPRRGRQALVVLGALGCLFFGVLLGERNAAGRLEAAEAGEDREELSCTVEVFDGPGEIETLRTVQARFRKAPELVEAVRRKLHLTERFPVAFDMEPDTNVIELRGPERMVATVHRALRELDVPVAQLLLDMRVMVADSKRARKAGLTEGGGAVPAAGSPAGIFACASERPHLAGIASALESKGHLRTLAAPRLLAADGQMAELAIGDSISFSPGPGRSAGASDAGVRVQMLPRFRADGRIELDLEIVLSGSEAEGLPTVVGGPQAGCAVLRTQGVVLSDGQEALVGGFLGPRFGPVPGSAAELLLLLTAHTVAQPRPPAAVARAPMDRP